MRIPRRLWPWLAWLAAFYSVWLSVVAVGGHGATLASHWPIALAMALGSYVAGSTPMGGGTVGFPVLVLLLDEPATLGRQFSFAVQSIGMTSASIFILCRGIPVAGEFLKGCLPAALLSTPAGILLVAPRVDNLATSLIFAVLWASFGLAHLLRLRTILDAPKAARPDPRFDRASGVVIGLVGGLTVAGITGVGIDMIAYIVLLLVARVDVRVAIPTSVIVMAFTSLVGISTVVVAGAEQQGLFGHWLAAAPIVILGAPLGAWIVMLIPRGPTLVFVSVLCVGQFAWTVYDQAVGGAALWISLAAVAASQGVFHLLFMWGGRRQSVPG